MDFLEEQERHHHSGRKINKERFCKKNKLGGDQYGSHRYQNGHCQLCGKIDPAKKHRSFGDNT